MIESIQNPSGDTIDYTFHDGAEGARDLLIIGHGVTGNKDRPFVIGLAEAVAAEGMPVLRFSFAGNGDSGGKFADCTISKEVDDLKAVLSAAERLKSSRTAAAWVFSIWSRSPLTKAVNRDRINASAVGAGAPPIIGPQHSSNPEPDPQAHSVIVRIFLISYEIVPNRAANRVIKAFSSGSRTPSTAFPTFIHFRLRRAASG